jgi:hypothetical protein
MCLRLNQVDQAANAQVPLKLFSLGVANRSFAIAFGKLIDSTDRPGVEFPFQNRFRDFRAEVTAIRGDHVCKDVRFGDLRRAAHS